MSNTCGYHTHTHYCQRNTVAFISRGFSQNDYCVSGHRVRVHDSGETTATPEQRAAILDYELKQYAKYIQWHCEQSFRVPLQPFTCMLGQFAKGAASQEEVCA